MNSEAIFTILFATVSVLGLRYAWKWAFHPVEPKQRNVYTHHGFEVITPAADAGMKERENDHG